MKKLIDWLENNIRWILIARIFITILLLSISCSYGQKPILTIPKNAFIDKDCGTIMKEHDTSTNIINDTIINPICKQRGHVQGQGCMSTLLYCPPYLEENDSISVMVYPSCNDTRCTCLRCGKQYSLGINKETRIVIWKKNP